MRQKCVVVGGGDNGDSGDSCDTAIVFRIYTTHSIQIMYIYIYILQPIVWKRERERGGQKRNREKERIVEMCHGIE